MPNWSKLTVPEFIEWLLLEGPGGFMAFILEYEKVPWRLRIVWWDLAYEGGNWVEKALPGKVLGSEDYWHMAFAMSESIKGFRDAQVGYHAWLHTRCPNKMAGDEPPEWFKNIVSGEYGEEELNKDFEVFNKKITASKNTASLTEEQWDKLWFKNYPSKELLADPNVPIACLDRWRKMVHPKAADQCMDRHVILHSIGSMRAVPEDWVSHLMIIAEEVSGLSWRIIERYLNREDVPMEIRRSFREDPRDGVKAAAWRYGDYTEQELSELGPDGWQFLINRETVGDGIVEQMLNKAQPHFIAHWASKPGFSSEARLMMVRAGYSVAWWREDNTEVVDAGLETGNELIYRDMARGARKDWGIQRISELLKLACELPDMDDWTVRRLVNLGGTKVDKALLRALMTAKSKQVRLLASSWMKRERSETVKYG